MLNFGAYRFVYGSPVRIFQEFLMGVSREVLSYMFICPGSDDGFISFRVVWEFFGKFFMEVGLFFRINVYLELLWWVEGYMRTCLSLAGILRDCRYFLMCRGGGRVGY